MNTPAVNLDSLEQKTGRLIKQYRSLEKELDKCRLELEKLRLTESELRTRNMKIEEQLQMMKMTASNLDPATTKELDQRLNHYIREIDRCITVLAE